MAKALAMAQVKKGKRKAIGEDIEASCIMKQRKGNSSQLLTITSQSNSIPNEEEPNRDKDLGTVTEPGRQLDEAAGTEEPEESSDAELGLCLLQTSVTQLLTINRMHDEAMDS